MTSKNIYEILVDYIEYNETYHNIEYSDTIEYLQEILNEIKKDYGRL